MSVQKNWETYVSVNCKGNPCYVGFSDSHGFRSNPLQRYSVPLHVIRWLL